MAFWNKRRAERAAASAAVADPQEVRAPVEARASDIQRIASSDPNIVSFFGGAMGITDEVVTLDTALKVPAIWAAVSFLSRTLAGLPLKVYRKGKDGRKPRPDDPIARLLDRAANEEMSALDWRRGLWQDVFTAGRHVSFIELNGAGLPINIWPLEISKVTVERKAGRALYHYRDGARNVTYLASEVLDLCFMPGSDRLASRSPIYSNSDTVSLALAVTRYGARFFRNGGIPPFTISGPIQTPGGVARAAGDLSAAVKKLADEGGNALTIPEGHKLDALGIDPEKMQMVEVQRFLVEQIARIYTIPPVFLQDLTHGTFSNTEQQDLQLVKHLVAQWAKTFEAEANLKLWGRSGGSIYAEHVLDGLTRGDLKSRAEATAQRINSGQLTPNEARELENRPPLAGGDKLLVQGAMVPAEMAGEVNQSAGSASNDEGQTNE